MQADKSRLIQVVFNLLSNAVNSIKELEQRKLVKKGRQTRLPVKVEQNRQDDEESTIFIACGGTYFRMSSDCQHQRLRHWHDPEILPRLFCKFATKSFDGSGLGLYICKGIIEAHGGNIWAKNNVDGKGATFSFTLPLLDKRN